MQNFFLLFFNSINNPTNTNTYKGLSYRSVCPDSGTSMIMSLPTKMMEQFMGNPKERVGPLSYGNLCRPNPGNVSPPTPWSIDIINTKQPTEDRTQRWVSNPDELSKQQTILSCLLNSDIQI